jgi:hypothetical protein
VSWSVLRGKTRTRALARLLAQRNGILGCPGLQTTLRLTLFRKTNKLHSHRKGGSTQTQDGQGRVG